MTTSAYLVHATRHRTRLRIPAERGNAAYFERAAQALASQDTISYAAGNALTAGLLLEHKVAPSVETLSQWGREHELFEGVERSWPHSRPLSGASRNRSREIDERLRTVTGEHADLRTVAGVLLAVAAIVQAARGQILAPATSLLWYAIEALDVLPPPEGGRGSEDE